MTIRLTQVMLLLAMFGCSTATYIRASVTDNPLDRLAQKAQADWSVQRVDASTLAISDAWPIHSILSLGYSASHADLAYDKSESVLHIRYYLQSNQLFTLFLSMRLDAEPRTPGGALKGIMNQQISDILRWSGATMQSRRVGTLSDTFPPGGASAP
ncbi:MAG: hypothetical protein HP496_17395 [Nitrospira sp.]|nr:hypothetical protein [Nitrospira sp.]